MTTNPITPPKGASPSRRQPHAPRSIHNVRALPQVGPEDRDAFGPIPLRHAAWRVAARTGVRRGRAGKDRSHPRPAHDHIAVAEPTARRCRSGAREAHLALRGSGGSVAQAGSTESTQCGGLPQRHPGVEHVAPSPLNAIGSASTMSAFGTQNSNCLKRFQ